MGAFAWVLIALAVIIGGYIIDYQKNKLKWQDKSSQTTDDLEEIRSLLHQMKKRIENLEAIAANDPDSFKSESMDPLDRIEINEEENIKKDNENRVSNLAKSKGD
ncbi:hypothetical protein [Rhodohalobacter barkolensis]|uniref:Uncharacterized protein n=1 Tax=Rhodohalobacter barkolensis TaxID=2053187 RepID=A0A2N0VEP7_9BACT|nr:hypothetical protein [Rhodohalobacter barkolensis]PKD42669.1 hypothetical protein CWD77_14785 [Rhodohalobacter barkolensis]